MRHAWDIRLISVDSLLRLMTLREEVEDSRTLQMIQNILFPMEFTKLDEIVNLVFSAAEDVKQQKEPITAEIEETEII
jgi:predicted DNA-binding ArsR family transcriptional regulator